MTYNDFERIMATIPTVVGATPLREFGKNVRHLEQEIEGRIVGVNPDFLKLTGQQLEAGRFLTDADLFYSANVAVLGFRGRREALPLRRSRRQDDPHRRRALFPGRRRHVVQGPVGRHRQQPGGPGFQQGRLHPAHHRPRPLRRGHRESKSREASPPSGSSSRRSPSPSTRWRTSRGRPSALDSMLGQFHPKKDYAITVPLELLEKAEATQRIFNLVLGSIASISLLVGGIGIMNIMLATVSERTREIGIRRALGARRRDIIEQFLIETTVMSASGGLIGVLLGVAAPPLVSYLSGMPVVIRPWSPIIAFLIAVTIGVVFGVYPARRAAMLDPVEALRRVRPSDRIAEATSLCRRLRAHRAAADRHAFGQRAGRHAEAALGKLVADLPEQGEAVGIHPERDRRPLRTEPIDRARKLRERSLGRLEGLTPIVRFRHQLPAAELEADTLAREQLFHASREPHEPARIQVRRHPPGRPCC